MNVNAAGEWNSSWFTYQTIDPTGKAQGQYAILKPGHKKDAKDLIAAQREQFLQETRAFQAKIKADAAAAMTDGQTGVEANSAVELTDEQKAAFAGKYDPTDMTREEYIALVDDLCAYGILEGDDREWVQAKAEGLTLVAPGATHTLLFSDSSLPSMRHFDDCGGNVLDWAKYMSSFEYYDEAAMDFAPTRSALLFGKISGVLAQLQ